MARKIVVTSGKGGVGKTTMTAMLGICLAKKGERIALIDADFGLNNLDVCVGLDGGAPTQQGGRAGRGCSNTARRKGWTGAL